MILLFIIMIQNDRWTERAYEMRYARMGVLSAMNEHNKLAIDEFMSGKPNRMLYRWQTMALRWMHARRHKRSQKLHNQLHN